jgi:transposase-like protein
MRTSYQIVDKKDSRKLAEYLSQNGQLLLPLLELIEGAEMAVDELIDVAGRATIEAVLLMSAAGVAGERRAGKKRGEVCWYGSQGGVVNLRERKLKVRKPRLRKKGKGRGLEVGVPAYEVMQNDARLCRRILEILLRGVSTRKYAEVLPEMAETLGVSRSSVSREFIEASEQELKALCERRFDNIDLLIIYIDGQLFSEYHIITAVGVDVEGYKHVLGLREGASENATVATALLEDLVERGVKPGRARLFVIDGSKALRKAIDAVFGTHNAVQRCRAHKVKNVMGYLPEHLKDQVKAAMRGAFRLSAEEGIARLEKQAQWLEQEYPSAAASLREGLNELFTVNRIGLSPGLRRCLTTTNIIESPHSGVRRRTGRVSYWQDGKMVLRWAAASFLDAEKSFKRIMGYRDLWQLKAYLDNVDKENAIDMEKEVA